MYYNLYFTFLYVFRAVVRWGVGAVGVSFWTNSLLYLNQGGDYVHTPPLQTSLTMSPPDFQTLRRPCV